MSEYQAPLEDMHFVINELSSLDKIARLPGFEDATADMVEAILEQAFRHLGGKDSGESELYAERWVPFTKELAVMVRISFPLTLLSIAHVFIYVFLY